MKYDIVLSLGGCCAVAAQLQRRGLRPKSYALDWVGGRYDPASISMLAYGFRNRFVDFCQRDHLQESAIVALDGTLENGYFETLYKTNLQHSFADKTANPDWYESSMKVMRRRIVRMFDDLSGAKTAYLILATYYDFEYSLAEDLHAVLRETFPELKFRMRVMMFGAKTGPYGVDDGHGDIEIYRYQRDVCLYDMFKTSCEWSFMDDLELSRRPTPGWLVKALFRMYRKVGKWFLKRGLTFP